MPRFAIQANQRRLAEITHRTKSIFASANHQIPCMQNTACLHAPFLQPNAQKSSIDVALMQRRVGRDVVALHLLNTLGVTLNKKETKT